MDDRMHSQLDLYLRKCSELGLKPNSMLVKQLGRDASQPPCLSVYDFRRNYLGDRGVIPLADALGLDRGMRSLNLSNNGIRNRGTLALVDILAQHPGITQVDLSRNIISKTGGLALVKLLHKNPRVTAVDVNSTRIEDAITSQIRTALQTNQKRCTLETSKLQGATDETRTVSAPPVDDPAPACPPRAPSAQFVVPRTPETERVAGPAAKVEPQAAPPVAQAAKAYEGEGERAGGEKRVSRSVSKVRGVVLDTSVLGVSTSNPFQSGDLESKPVLAPEAAFAKAAARVFTLNGDVEAPNPFQSGELLAVAEDIEKAVEKAKVRRLDAGPDVDLPNPFQTAEIAPQPDLPIEHAMDALSLLPTPAAPHLERDLTCVPQPHSAPQTLVEQEHAGEVAREGDAAHTAPQECVTQVAAGSEQVEREAAKKVARVLVLGDEVPNPWQTGEQAVTVEDLDAEVDKYQSRRIPLPVIEGLELSNPFQTGDLLPEPDKPVDAMVDAEEAATQSVLAGEADGERGNLRRVTLAGGLELGNPFQSGEVSSAPEQPLEVVAVKAAARVLTLCDEVEMQNPFQSAQVAAEPDKPIDAVLDKLASRQVTLSDGLDVANPFQTADIALEPDVPIDTVLEHLSKNGAIAPPTHAVAPTDADTSLTDVAADEAEPRGVHTMPNHSEAPQPRAHQDHTFSLPVLAAAPFAASSSVIPPLQHHHEPAAHKPRASDTRDADQDVTNVAAGGVSVGSEGGAAGDTSREAVAQGVVADEGLQFGVELASGLESMGVQEAQEAPGTPIYKDLILEPASPAPIPPHLSDPHGAVHVPQAIEDGPNSCTQVGDVQSLIGPPPEWSQPAAPAANAAVSSELLPESHTDTCAETEAAEKDEHAADGARDSAHGQEDAAASGGSVAGVTESLEDALAAPLHAAVPDITQHHDDVSHVVNQEESARAAEAGSGVSGVDLGEVAGMEGGDAVTVMHPEPDGASRRGSSAFTFAVQPPPLDAASAQPSGPREPSQGLSGPSVVDKARDVLGSSALQGSLYAAKNFDLILTPATPFEGDPRDLDAPNQPVTDQHAVDAATSEPVAPAAHPTAVDSTPLTAGSGVDEMQLRGVWAQDGEVVMQEHTAAPPAEPIAQTAQHDSTSSDAPLAVNDATEEQPSASVGVVESDAAPLWMDEAQAVAAAAPTVEATAEEAASPAAPSFEPVFAVEDEQRVSSMPMHDVAHPNPDKDATDDAHPQWSAPDTVPDTKQDNTPTEAAADSSAAGGSEAQGSVWQHDASDDAPPGQTTTNRPSEDMQTLDAVPSLPSGVDVGDMAAVSTGQGVEHDETACIGSGPDAAAPLHEDSAVGSGSGESEAAQLARDAGRLATEAPVALASAADMEEAEVALGAGVLEEDPVETAPTATIVPATTAQPLQHQHAPSRVHDHPQASHAGDPEPYLPEQQPGHAVVTEPAETAVGVQSDEVADEDACGQEGQIEQEREASHSQMREIEELIITQVEQQLGASQAAASQERSSSDIAAQVRVQEAPINTPHAAAEGVQRDVVESFRDPDALTQEAAGSSERVDLVVHDTGHRVPSHATEMAPEESVSSAIGIEPASQTELQHDQPSTDTAPEYSATADSHNTLEQPAPLETLPPDVPMASETAEAAVADSSQECAAVAGTSEAQQQDTPLPAHESPDAAEHSVADDAPLLGHADAALQEVPVDSDGAHRAGTPDDLDTRPDFWPPMPHPPVHQPPHLSAPSHPEPALVLTETDDRSISARPSADDALPAAATEGASTPALESSLQPEPAFVPTQADDASVSAAPFGDVALPAGATEGVTSCVLQAESAVQPPHASSHPLQNTQDSAAAVDHEGDTQVAHTASMQPTDSDICSDESTAPVLPASQQLVSVPLDDCTSDSNPQAESTTALIYNDASVGEAAAARAVAAQGDAHSETQGDRPLRDTDDPQQQLHDAPTQLHTASYTADSAESDRTEPSYAHSSAPPHVATSHQVVTDNGAAPPMQVEHVSETPSYPHHIRTALPDGDHAASENAALPPEATDSTDADGSADSVEVS